jgi:uncharacterized protein YijF (DUF1287 family)
MKAFAVFCFTMITMIAALPNSSQAASSCSADVIVELKGKFGSDLGQYRPASDQDAHFISYLISENGDLKRDNARLDTKVDELKRRVWELETAFQQSQNKEVTVECACKAGDYDFGRFPATAANFGLASEKVNKMKCSQIHGMCGGRDCYPQAQDCKRLE